jgi:hypothetical protein
MPLRGVEEREVSGKRCFRKLYELYGTSSRPKPRLFGNDILL